MNSPFSPRQIRVITLGLAVASVGMMEIAITGKMSGVAMGYLTFGIALVLGTLVE